METLEQCGHQLTILTRRTYSNGVTHYVEQCQNCGTMTRSRKKSEIPNGTQLPEWDESIAERYQDLRRESWQERVEQREQERDKEHQEWLAQYSAYLETYGWKQKRDKVLDRCRGICEGCGTERATVVHHKTYRDVGNEFLFQLVGLCKACHDRYHDR